MYRVLSSGLACVVTLAGAMAANATSFFTPAESGSTATPSIVTIGDGSGSILEARGSDGEPAAGRNVNDGQLLVLSGSILAAGPDAIPVASEQVSSVEEQAERPKPRWISQALPTIIRGGMHGDAAPSAPASEAATAADELPAGTSVVSPR